MKTLHKVLLSVIFLAVTASAQASVIPVDTGFEINYAFNLQRGTLHGSNVTDIFIFETDGSQVNVDSGFSAAAQGPSTLSHVIGFHPTLAFVLGLDRAPVDSGLVDHLVVFMDNDFADNALMQARFSDVFPAVGNRDRVRHSILAQAVSDAAMGNDDARQILMDFFLLDGGQFASFNPEDSFRVVEFSPPMPIDVVPEPASLLLFGSGMVGAFVRRRKRA